MRQCAVVGQGESEQLCAPMEGSQGKEQCSGLSQARLPSAACGVGAEQLGQL